MSALKQNEATSARKERWGAVIRIALGTAQIMGATMALVFLVQAGVSRLSVGACVATGLLTILSRFLFSAAAERKVLKKFAAELLGTFSLVFAGTGAIIINDVSGGAVSHVGVALTFGLIVVAMIYALGDVSGAHLNPAVTLGFWVARRLPSRWVFPYAVSQCAGALLASILLRRLFPQHATLGATLT